MKIAQIFEDWSVNPVTTYLVTVEVRKKKLKNWLNWENKKKITEKPNRKKKNRLNWLEYLKKYSVRFHKSEIKKPNRTKINKKKMNRKKPSQTGKKNPLDITKKNPKKNIVFSF